MVSRPWIKVYSSILNDPKIGRLSDDRWRLFFELVLMASNSGVAGYLPPFDYILKVLSRHKPYQYGKRENLYKDMEALEVIGLLERVGIRWRVSYWLNIVARHYRGGSWLDRKTKECVIIRDQSTCRYCGDYFEHIDHIIPKSRGGPNTLDNLVCACELCNIRKSDRTPKEAGMVLMDLDELIIKWERQYG